MLFSKKELDFKRNISFESLPFDIPKKWTSEYFKRLFKLKSHTYLDFENKKIILTSNNLYQIQNDCTNLLIRTNEYHQNKKKYLNETVIYRMVHSFALKQLLIGFVLIVGNAIAQSYIIYEKNPINLLIVFGLVIAYPLYIQLKDYVIPPINKKPSWYFNRLLSVSMIIPLTIVAMVLAMVGYNSLISVFSQSHITSTNQAQLSQIALEIPKWRMALMVCVLAPIVEEYLLRYTFLQRWVTQSNSPDQQTMSNNTLHLKPFKTKEFWIFLILQGFIFGIMHVTTSELLQAFISLPTYMFIGIGAGVVYALTGSSKYNILFHSLYNMLALSAMYIT